MKQKSITIGNSKKPRGDLVTLIEEENDADDDVVIDEDLIESETDFGSLKSRLSQTLQAIKSWKKTFPTKLSNATVRTTER